METKSTRSTRASFDACLCLLSYQRVIDRPRLRNNELVHLRPGGILQSAIVIYHHPTNGPIAGVQAFLMDNIERAIAHHAGPVRIGGC
jgi:hypothetical protein